MKRVIATSVKVFALLLLVEAWVRGPFFDRRILPRHVTPFSVLSESTAGQEVAIFYAAIDRLPPGMPRVAFLGDSTMKTMALEARTTPYLVREEVLRRRGLNFKPLDASAVGLHARDAALIVTKLLARHVDVIVYGLTARALPRIETPWVTRTNELLSPAELLLLARAGAGSWLRRTLTAENIATGVVASAWTTYALRTDLRSFLWQTVSDGLEAHGVSVPTLPSLPKAPTWAPRPQGNAPYEWTLREFGLPNLNGEALEVIGKLCQQYAPGRCILYASPVNSALQDRLAEPGVYDAYLAHCRAVANRYGLVWRDYTSVLGANFPPRAWGGGPDPIHMSLDGRVKLAALLAAPVADAIRTAEKQAGVTSRAAAVEGQGLSDQNGDGSVTFCIIGDSRIGGPLFGTKAATGPHALPPQVTNVYQCGSFYARSLDVLNHLSEALNGNTTGLLACTVRRGDPGKPCDYALMEVDVNDYHSIPQRPRGVGVCYDAGHADDLGPCTCVVAPSMEHPPPAYCLTGAVAGQPCARGPTDCAICQGGPNEGRSCTPRCAGGANAGAECAAATNCASGECFIDYDCPGSQCNPVKLTSCDSGPKRGHICTSDLDCQNSMCWPHAGVRCDPSPQAANCQAGCRTVPGCDGVCVMETPLSYGVTMSDTFARALAEHPAHPRVIWVLPAMTRGDQPGCWGPVADILSALHPVYRQQAARWNWNTIDLQGEYERVCKPWTDCLADGVHPNVAGVDALSDAIRACVSADATFPGARNVACDHL